VKVVLKDKPALYCESPGAKPAGQQPA
jgi:hypothetical protein